MSDIDVYFVRRPMLARCLRRVSNTTINTIEATNNPTFVRFKFWFKYVNCRWVSLDRRTYTRFVTRNNCHWYAQTVLAATMQVLPETDCDALINRLCSKINILFILFSQLFYSSWNQQQFSTLWNRMIATALRASVRNECTKHRQFSDSSSVLMWNSTI